jgi:hypothetical protein
MSAQTDLKEFDELLATVTVSIKPIMAITVSDASSEADARSAGGQIATLKKRLETRRKELLEPLKRQVEVINAAAKNIEAVLNEPEAHIRSQLNAYSAELTRKRNEELRIQREKEEAERRAAAEKRRQEEEALRARQEEERKTREAAAKAEQERINAELEAKRKQAESEAAAKAKAADLFGRSAAAKQKAEQEAAEAQRRAEEQAEAERRNAEQKAADEAKALADQQERERIAEEARLAREESERQLALEAERKQIEAQRVKGAKVEIEISVVDPWSVPREFLRDPEVKLAEVKKAYKSGRTQIPGLTIQESSAVSIRAESVPRAGIGANYA